MLFPFDQISFPQIPTTAIRGPSSRLDILAEEMWLVCIASSNNILLLDRLNRANT